MANCPVQKAAIYQNREGEGLIEAMDALEADHACSASLVQSGWQRKIIPEIVHE
jgi:hypothetical protein